MPLYTPQTHPKVLLKDELTGELIPAVSYNSDTDTAVVLVFDENNNVVCDPDSPPGEPGPMTYTRIGGMVFDAAQ